MTETKKFDVVAWVKAHGSDFAAYGGLVVCIIIFTIFPPLRGESMWSAAKLSTLMSNVIVTALLSVGYRSRTDRPSLQSRPYVISEKSP